jgi:uncharacterized protein (TIGR02217 family)
MTAFHEVRLPARLAFGSTGGVERRTEVVTLASGYERRASPWAHGRRRYLIGAGVRALDDAAALVAFFEARRGRLHGFRFKDFADFKSCAPSVAVAATDQAIGVGDGVATAFQLVKAYGDVAREVRKPVAGSVVAALDGVVTTAFTVDAATGVVTFDAPPGVGVEITAGFEFDTPVRFDTDRIDVTLEGFDAGRVVAVPLVEVRI